MSSAPSLMNTLKHMLDLALSNRFQSQHKFKEKGLTHGIVVCFQWDWSDSWIEAQEEDIYEEENIHYKYQEEDKYERIYIKKNHRDRKEKKQNSTGWFVDTFSVSVVPLLNSSQSPLISATRKTPLDPSPSFQGTGSAVLQINQFRIPNQNQFHEGMNQFRSQM